MKRIPWWGWAAALIVVGYVFVKWYANHEANAAANAALNPTASQVPFDNGVQSDLSTLSVEELLQYEQQINSAAASSSPAVAGNGTNSGVVAPFFPNSGGYNPTTLL